MVVCIVVCMIVGYLFGCIQTGYIVGRVNKIDIRDYGSGNSGTTNTLRTLGETAAIITFLGDAAKGLVAVNLARYVIMPAFGVEGQAYLWLLTGFAVVLGHNFPFYMKFKGGKGVASTFGFILVTCWPVAVIALGIWLVMAFAFRYSSLSALTAAVFVPVASYFLAPSLEYTVVYALVVLLVIVRHHGNIRRLLNGEESKIKLKKQ